jgi:hypothetical protein
MAHFARIESNVVKEVIVVNNEVLLDENGIEQESIGSQFCADLLGGEWIQTSYNKTFRKRFAAVGMKYYPDLDQFGEDPIEEPTE